MARDRVVHMRDRQSVLRRADARASRLESRMQYLLDLARDAFVETDGDGVLTEWNRQAELRFGWSRDEVLGRPLVEFLVPGRNRTRFLDDLHGSRGYLQGIERSEPYNLTLLHRDGHEIQVTTSAYVIGTGDDLRLGGFVHDRGEERAAEEALAHAYLHDSLTGLPNRTLFTYRLSYALARGRGEPGSAAVLVLDLDRFKAINDALGHEVGDEVLVAAAERLVAVDTSATLVARLGGDEFLALFDGEFAEEDAVAFADRALSRLSEPIVAGGREVFVGASIGIACTSAELLEPAALLSCADAAMYQAKTRGGGAIEVFGEALRLRALDRLQTEHSLHRALEREELRLHYQPVIDIGGGHVVAVEALVRWKHPTQGLVSPDRFIPVAEESGLIIPIGRWVLREACEQLRTWVTGPGRSGPVAVEVNLSARQLDDAGIVDTVEQILDESGLTPSSLTLEITESALMRDAASALQVLRALKALGVTLAIDDFGTGYSSLSYLHRFPLDVLKVDKSFVDGLGSGGDGMEIVAAVIKLAHALGLQVVAEGVECAAQLEQLASMGCDFAQGYLFSRPVPAQEVEQKLPLRLGA